ncbi:hypothetical protein DPMN_043073 [Dreissena polymorpha]|uniref:Uncharacterized protein n=1 Tax=Dreissena polymorpha TaxID=45954 RepID=A0A9D4D378_DREPO|nr:hypothetical protein DPMN_043073 [Dreissena polymorpha]
MSARYLVGAGRKEEAFRILQSIAKISKTQLPEGELVEEMQVSVLYLLKSERPVS